MKKKRIRKKLINNTVNKKISTTRINKNSDYEVRKIINIKKVTLPNHLRQSPASLNRYPSR